MKIAVIGATGKTGQRVTTELLQRGHHVTAVVRNPSKVQNHKNLSVVTSDLSDAKQIAGALEGADAVVSAYGAPADNTEQVITVTRHITNAAKQNKQRLLVVGGAASLFIKPGVTVLAAGYVPEWGIPIATAHNKVLEDLRRSDVDWTYFSPAAFFEPGERTGKFRLGKDDLIADASGKSHISMEDYAIATVDELEKPAHRRERFTIGY
ncbi:NAD(P)-dependent oxidoreductase [Alloacidobacterium dinghuense]|uniref:NAD(P)-dependent oxidoreductase n=1 Tax=Alloacidobacterium dinghuense TaxID=2763107 RepID=A0A7G8BGG8_9BACT|nr:NAD(P)-dependent oxidoreductase [Alloacidobacterium dinghuense]QNI31638.1 NAD(P)-dependent oxidoreductase [Alloacidobacterium dinghuense]